MSEIELSKYFLTKKIPYVKPLYNINLENESEILDWFRECSYGLTEYFIPLFREQKSNLAYFVGAGVNPNWSSPYTQVYANTSDIFSKQPGWQEVLAEASDIVVVGLIIVVVIAIVEVHVQVP